MNLLLNRGGLGLSTRYLADSECLTPMNYTYQTYQSSKIRWVYHFRKSHWRNLLDTHLEAAWVFSHAKTLLSIIILLILTAVVYCCRGSRSFVGVAGETVTFAHSEMVVEMFPIRVPWRLFFSESCDRSEIFSDFPTESKILPSSYWEVDASDRQKNGRHHVTFFSQNEDPSFLPSYQDICWKFSTTVFEESGQ